jgi:serine phosphatase RsbU (regulator of sigma subunit)
MSERATSGYTMFDRAAPPHATAALLLRVPEGKPRSLTAWIALNLTVLVVYSLAGLVVVFFGIGPAKVSPIYPPSGIAAAAVFILGPRILPAIFIGQFCNGFPLLELPQTTWPLYVLTNSGTGFGAVAEAMTAAVLLRTFAVNWHPFDRALHVVIFLLGSCLTAAAVGGTIGTLWLWGTGFIPNGELGMTFVTFILADAAGIAVFGALIVAWYREPRLDRQIVVSAALILAGTFIIAGLEAWLKYPIDYLYLPLLLYAGIHAGPRGVTLAAAAITIAVVQATVAGTGQFVGTTTNESFLLLQVFMAVITFTGLLLAAVRGQQLEADAALQAHNLMLEQRVAQRTAEVAEKNRLLEEKQARIDEDLKTAQLLQASILPTDFSPYAGTAIAASMRPALEVGGDFYDVFALQDGRLGLVIADVSGKGVAAAFFMAVTRTMLRSAALTEAALADCVGEVNRALCRENPMCMFVTALYAELDAHSGAVNFVNAGHCEPIVMDGAGNARLIKRSGNPPLGVLEERAFVAHSFVLAPGEMLFLYTDGVTEAPNRAGELFKTARLLEITRQFGRLSPQDLMLSVIDNVERFSAGTVQADDITCLIVRRNLQAASAPSDAPPQQPIS